MVRDTLKMNAIFLKLRSATGDGKETPRVPATGVLPVCIFGMLRYPCEKRSDSQGSVGPLSADPTQ